MLSQEQRIQLSKDIAMVRGELPSDSKKELLQEYTGKESLSLPEETAGEPNSTCLPLEDWVGPTPIGVDHE